MYYENNVGKVYYEVYGEENEEAVIFCHGVSMDHETFMPQVEGLKDKYRIIVWDLPYHGKSSAVDDDLQFSSVAGEFLIELLSHLDIDKAVLAGQSLGSVVVQQAAHQDRARTRATVHIGGAPLYPSFSPLIKVFNPLIALAVTLCPGCLLYSAFAKHKAIKDETRAYLKEVSSRAGKKVIIHLSQEMISDMVQGIPAPTDEPRLICHGDQEAFFLKKIARSWHEKSSSSQLAVIQNAHHIANQDNPVEFNRKLLSFLKTIGPANHN